MGQIAQLAHGRIAQAREERMRFVMELSVRATDTMLEGCDPVAGTLWKTQPPFLAELSSLFREVALGDELAPAA